jgi:hypothetical protein
LYIDSKLDVLSGFNFIKSFSTFCILSTGNTFSEKTVVWWLGDATDFKNLTGYGLTLSGNKLYNSFGFIDRTRYIDTLEPNTLYNIATIWNTDKKFPNDPSNAELNYTQRILINGVSKYRGTEARTVNGVRRSRVGYGMSNYDFKFNPYSTGNFKLLEFYMYDRALPISNIIAYTTISNTQVYCAVQYMNYPHTVKIYYYYTYFLKIK